jgi:hypothetical protein
VLVQVMNLVDGIHLRGGTNGKLDEALAGELKC